MLIEWLDHVESPSQLFDLRFPPNDFDYSAVVIESLAALRTTLQPGSSPFQLKFTTTTTTTGWQSPPTQHEPKQPDPRRTYDHHLASPSDDHHQYRGPDSWEHTD
jgi:hypothetical protein